MVVESFPNVLEWLSGGALTFLVLLATGTVLGIVFGFLVASWRHGPAEGFYSVAGVLAATPGDFLGTRFRRIWAIARLAIKEAFRRRVLLVTFLIFAGLLLFGGWYLGNVEHPERVYINFVMFGTQLLVLLVGLLISAFSLPEDIRNRTIFTVVTKPVRATEIVLGRIVGFGVVVSGLLFLMGLVSFFFVWRGLSHTHLIAGDQQTVSSLQPVDSSQGLKLNARGARTADNAVLAGETGFEAGHSHFVELVEDVRDPGDEPMDRANVVSRTERADGKIVFRRVQVQPANGHTHSVTVSSEGDGARIALGNAAGFFRARRPHYAASMKTFDSSGDEGKVSVGKEWNYRTYVDGGSAIKPETLSRAEFDFVGLQASDFPGDEYVVLEATLSVYRTHVGDIQKRVYATVQFESIPGSETEPRLQSEPIRFETREMSIQPIPVGRRLSGRKLAPDGTILEEGMYGLFEDFVGGDQRSLRVILRCDDRNQYLGVATPDIYFRGKDDLYWWNFIKGYLGLWAQMMVVVSVAVAFSTFLSTPVTILGSLVFFLIGYCAPFIRALIQPEAEGGGPIESFFRIIRQQNMQGEPETTFLNTLMMKTDDLILYCMNSLTYIAPSFRDLDFSAFLTYGYSVSNDRMIVALLMAFAFSAGAAITGYFTLKTREIAGQT